MSELRLITEELGDGPFSGGTPLPHRLPPGRHGIPPGLVVEHQRRRLLAAMAEALAEHGYANVTTTQVSEQAGVSTATFYKHFGNLWDCALAAYVWSADRLCEAIETSCPAMGDASEVEAEALDTAELLEAGIVGALAFFAAEPARARLLSTQAPREASALFAARRLLVSRLAALLRRARGDAGDAPQPVGLDERLIDATLVFVGAQVARGDVNDLVRLAPELTAILDRQRCAA